MSQTFSEIFPDWHRLPRVITGEESQKRRRTTFYIWMESPEISKWREIIIESGISSMIQNHHFLAWGVIVMRKWTRQWQRKQRVANLPSSLEHYKSCCCSGICVMHNMIYKTIQSQSMQHWVCKIAWCLIGTKSSAAIMLMSASRCISRLPHRGITVGDP